MTVRGFLMCYLGAVLLVGSAGAAGYHALERHHAQLAARATAEPPAAASPALALAQAQPDAPISGLSEPSPLPAGNDQTETVPEQYHRVAGPRALSVPPLRPHIATADHAPRPEHRPIARAVAARPIHRPATLARVTQVVPRRYVPPLRPAGGYAEPPPPSVAYYAYPGYRAYQPGYAYYYPYYRAY